MKMIFIYLKRRIKVISVFIIFALVFAVSFYLYGLPVQVIFYAALVCLFIGVVLTAVDFVKSAGKHKLLQNVKNEINITADHLPKPDDFIENDYQQIILDLFGYKNKLENESSKRYTELVDYYTIWAHQIKTPIASMYLSLHNEDSEFSRSIADDLMKIEQYVEMVMMVLRLDSGYTDYVIREYSLDDIIKQSLRRLAPQFIRRKIELKYEATSCMVLTDEKWILFVIEQILSNSLKYTKPGGKITINTEPEKVLCIKDNGIGIAPEDIPRVFDKGYTGYNGRSDKKASGIGLYLCKRICDNLGHKIKISSDAGSGTAVRIYLKAEKLKVE